MTMLRELLALLLMFSAAADGLKRIPCLDQPHADNSFSGLIQHHKKSLTRRIPFVTRKSQGRHRYIASGFIDAESTGVTVTAPDFPGHYPSDVETGWRIRARHIHHRVVIKILGLDIDYSQNCTDDYIKIFDGPDEHATLAARLCGSQAFPYWRSNGRDVYLVFRSARRPKPFQSDSAGYQFILMEERLTWTSNEKFWILFVNWTIFGGFLFFMAVFIMNTALPHSSL